jgi:hypothetical protein
MLHIVASSFSNWDGAVQKRSVKIKGDEMTWNNPTSATVA